jgi:hypothetical protein
MTATHNVPKKITAVLALVFLLPAVYIFAIWLKVYSPQDDSIARKDALFTSYFPGQINDVSILHYISIAFCITAIILAAKSFRQKNLLLRIAMMLTVLVASLIFFLNVFQVI